MSLSASPDVGNPKAEVIFQYRLALVFFISPVDPRFLSTLNAILKTPERGGLTANHLVYRYDVTKVDDGVGGEEGAFRE